MAVYHQMGEKSHGLLFEAGLHRFRGAILSPVNDDVAATHKLVQQAAKHGSFELIFDPQLYVLPSNRGKLPGWPHFPKDVDTADKGSLSWWDSMSDRIVAMCEDLRIGAVCSPAFIPNRFDNSYFDLLVRIGNSLVNRVSGTRTTALQTVVVGVNELTDKNRTLEIASILARSKSARIYLVFLTDVEPRRELSNADHLSGAMRLIAALRTAGFSVLVGYTSYDLVLWKAAGATDCASGKFFNLRRFTRSRFDEPSEGGSQLPYWFEEGLLGLLRETDIVRVQNATGFSEASLRNPYCAKILNQLKDQPGKPWIALGWRQYLYGIADLEHRIDTDRVDFRAFLKDAENAWLALEDAGVLMEERRNTGEWLRAWRRALVEYQKD